MGQIESILNSLPCHAAFQWVPGHCGLPSNEKADQVARDAALEGRRDEQSQMAPITFKAAKLAIRREVRDPDIQHGRVHRVY